MKDFEVEILELDRKIELTRIELMRNLIYKTEKETKEKVLTLIKNMHEYNIKSIAETDIPVIDKNLLLKAIEEEK
jgi:uncharacterized protein involved in tolerance to divalent cations